MSEPVLNKVWLHDCRHEIWSIQCLAIHDRRSSPIRQNTLNCVKQESVYFVQFVINWISLMVARSSVFPREELCCIIGLCQRHFCYCLDTRQPINSVDQSEKSGSSVLAIWFLWLGDTSVIITLSWREGLSITLPHNILISFLTVGPRIKI